MNNLFMVLEQKLKSTHSIQCQVTGQPLEGTSHKRTPLTAHSPSLRVPRIKGHPWDRAEGKKSRSLPLGLTPRSPSSWSQRLAILFLGKPPLTNHTSFPGFQTPSPSSTHCQFHLFNGQTSFTTVSYTKMPQGGERGPTLLKTLYLLFILVRTLLAVCGQEPWLGKQEFPAYSISSLPLAPGETVLPDG